MKAHISRIVLNTTKKIDLNKDDIVVFVGPNNAGKSKALADIDSLCGRKYIGDWVNPIIIKELNVEKCDIECIEEDAIKDGWAIKKDGKYWYSGIGGGDSNLKDTASKEYLGNLKSVFLTYLRAGSHGEANMAYNEMMEMGRNQAIQFIADFEDVRERASDGFRRAFGKDLLPHRLNGSGIPLCVGFKERLNDVTRDKVGNDSLDAYKEYMDSLPQVQHQSDGVRSFASTLVNLSLKYKQIYLLDEPETFLHPPQAFIMGQLIGEFLENRQAFISTHSQEIIKGLLDSCPNRVKIIRITRDEEKNSNEFKVLDNKDVQELWKDPLLKYSEILNGLFHSEVIVCESDSDCKLYSAVLSNIKEKENKYLQTKFVQANGKQRVYKIVSYLMRLGIKAYSILDIDVLSNEDDLKKIVVAHSGKWDDISHKYKVLQGNLNESVTNVNRADVKLKINEIINASNKIELSKSEIKEIEKLMAFSSKWGKIKQSGESGIPAGEGFNAYTFIRDYLKNIGIIIVPVGELENFVKSIGGHGPEWVSNVLETYQDLNSKEYEEITRFVKSWGI